MSQKQQKTRRLKKDRPLWPLKYFKGLTRKQKLERKQEIAKFKRIGYKSRKAYVPWKTDQYIKTKTSGYTTQWKTMFPDAKSLEARAAATGVPVQFLRESYKRGVGAWTTGHRPGATAEQWGFARTSSLLLCGKTFLTTDSDLARKAMASSAAARKWWTSQCPQHISGVTKKLSKSNE
jgi:hypothetical protein